MEQMPTRLANARLVVFLVTSVDALARAQSATEGVAAAPSWRTDHVEGRPQITSKEGL